MLRYRDLRIKHEYKINCDHLQSIEFKWYQMASNGFKWIQLDSNGFKLYQMNSNMDSIGLKWILMNQMVWCNKQKNKWKWN